MVITVPQPIKQSLLLDFLSDIERKFPSATSEIEVICSCKNKNLSSLFSLNVSSPNVSSPNVSSPNVSSPSTPFPEVLDREVNIKFVSIKLREVTLDYVKQIIMIQTQGIFCEEKPYNISLLKSEITIRDQGKEILSFDLHWDCVKIAARFFTQFQTLFPEFVSQLPINIDGTLNQ